MATTLQSADSAVATPESTAQLAALLHTAGVAALDDTGWIRVTGEDRVRWLNGMVTNSIADLAPGQSCYNFVLNAQGRIQGDLTAFLLEDCLLLETGADQVEKLLTHLNHFIIMDDVELADITDQRKGILIAGPDAARLIAAIDLSSRDDLGTLELVHAKWHSAQIDLIRQHGPLVPKFELWSDPDTSAIVHQQLLIAGTTDASARALEHLRILEGTPRYGTDIRDSETAHDLPQETAQTRALHFSKGCYLGQEIVERIRSRGKVHRTFTGFELEGALPTPGTVLHADGKSIGELTSVSAIPLAESDTNPSGHTLQLALGSIRREPLDRGLTIEYPGGIAIPIALPYALRSRSSEAGTPKKSAT